MLLYQCLVLLAIVQISVLQNIEINTPLGKIQGSRLISRLGKTIYSFRGIRYAQAPINELRFQVRSFFVIILYIKEISRQLPLEIGVESTMQLLTLQLVLNPKFQA